MFDGDARTANGAIHAIDDAIGLGNVKQLFAKAAGRIGMTTADRQSVGGDQHAWSRHITAFDGLLQRHIDQVLTAEIADRREAGHQHDPGVARGLVGDVAIGVDELAEVGALAEVHREMRMGIDEARQARGLAKIHDLPFRRCRNKAAIDSHHATLLDDDGSLRHRLRGNRRVDQGAAMNDEVCRRLCRVGKTVATEQRQCDTRKQRGKTNRWLHETLDKLCSMPNQREPIHFSCWPSWPRRRSSRKPRPDPAARQTHPRRLQRTRRPARKARRQESRLDPL